MPALLQKENSFGMKGQPALNCKQHSRYRIMPRWASADSLAAPVSLLFYQNCRELITTRNCFNLFMVILLLVNSVCRSASASSSEAFNHLIRNMMPDGHR